MKAGRDKVSTESPCSLCCSQERLPQLDNQSGRERSEPWQTVHAPAPGIELALQCKMDVLALKDAFFFQCVSLHQPEEANAYWDFVACWHWLLESLNTSRLRAGSMEGENYQLHHHMGTTVGGGVGRWVDLDVAWEHHSWV